MESDYCFSRSLHGLDLSVIKSHDKEFQGTFFHIFTVNSLPNSINHSLQPDELFTLTVRKMI